MQLATQLSGQIQPHGVLFVLEEPELKILQASSNSYSVFGISPAEILEKPLEEILDPYQVEKIKAGLTDENFDYINPTKVWARTQGDNYLVFDALFHRNKDGFLILELEPTFSQESIPFLSFYHLARASINQLEKTANLRDF